MYRVLHAPIEIAGQVGLICQQLQKNGIPAIGYNTFRTYLGYQKGIVETDAYQLQQVFEPALETFDLFHFHNSYTFFEDHRDLMWLAERGKKIVMHHRGNDVRSSVRARKGDTYFNPYVSTHCSFPDEQIERNLKLFAKYVSAVIVQDYELYHYVHDYYPRVFVLPRLINLSKKEPVYPSVKQRVPTIVHAPTDRRFKGSDIIEQVLADLKRSHDFQYVLVQNMSHAEALRCYQNADIVIDQILCGAYGNLSVEAMALGKPVIAYIRDDLVGTYPPGLPIVSANPDTLKEQLRTLLESPELRRELGKRGRRYVEANHDAPIVIRKLIGMYNELMGERS